LSGGQQQRVALARALAMSPLLLRADEPTGTLDTQSADTVFSLLQQVNQERGMAILFVTHNPTLARRCERIVRVVDGRIVADEATGAVAAPRPASPPADGRRPLGPHRFTAPA
jgi:lipoprotein-releasing system ATP-binding protein